MLASTKRRKYKTILNIFYLSLLNQVLAFAVALLFLWMQDWFDKGDIYSFLNLSIAHSISIGILGVIQRQYLHINNIWARLAISSFVGVLYAILWVYAIIFLMLGASIMAFGISILLVWMISGTVTLIFNTLFIDNEDSVEQSDKPIIEQNKKRSYLKFAGMFLLLPVGSIVAIWIAVFVGLFASVLFSWEWKEGAISTSEYSGGQLENNNTLLTSMNGHRRISKSELEEISIYHAVIVEPDVRIVGSGYGYYSDGPVRRKVLNYQIEFDSGIKQWSDSLVIELHLKDSTVRVGDSLFNLIDGNFFFVTLDSMFKSTTTQFPITNDKVVSCSTIVEQFNSVLEGYISDYPLVLRP